MEEAYSFFIFLAILGGLGSMLYFYLYFKEKRKILYFLIAAIICFFMPCFTVLGMLLNSQKLLIAAFLLPISAFVIATEAEILVRYQKCTCVVTAKCVSYVRRSRGRYYAPQFSYHYKGSAFSVDSFAGYPRRKIQKYFEIGKTYEIHINPELPKQCVDKRFSSAKDMVLLILFVILLLFSIWIVITIQ